MKIYKKIIFIFIIWLFIFLFGLITLEIGLQIYKRNDPWEKTIEFNLLRNINYKIYIKNLYSSKKEYIQYTRNYFGLRDNCPNINEIKILTIGGSTTDQRYVDNEDTFQSVLQKKISNHIGKEICISNAGVDGHSTFGHIESFKHWFPLIPNLKPTYIILYIGLNDADFNRIGPNYGFDKKDNKNLLKNYHVGRRLLIIYGYFIKDKNLAYAMHQKKEYDDINYSVTTLNKNTIRRSYLNTKEFEKRLKKILISINKMGSTHICITNPNHFVKIINGVQKGVPRVMKEEFSGLDFEYSLNQINFVMKKLCGTNNFIDIHAIPLKKDYFYDGVHTTDLGSIEIGNEIFESMVQLNLLEKLSK